MSDKQDIFTSDTKDASTDKKKKPKSARIVFDDKPMVAVEPVEEKRTLESLSLEELKRQVDAILSEAVDVAAGQLLPEDLIVDSQTGTVCECPATMSGTDTVDDDLLQKNLRDIPSPPEEALEQFNEHVAKSTKSVFGPGSPIDLISVIPKRSQETSSLSSDIPSPPDEALSAFNEHVAKSTSSVFGQGSPIDLIVVIPKQSEESTSLSSDSGLERIEKSTINEESSGNNTETETTGTSMPDTPATGSFASGTLEKSLLSVTEKSLASPAETSPTVSRVESSSLGTESAVGESDKEEATEDDEGRSNEAEIGSDEDLEEDDEVEVEIEEVEYGSSEAESEEEIEISEPEPEKSDVNVHGNMNGGGDATEESRHATASSETAAENEYSEEEITDDEDEVEGEEEIIEIEEEEEEEEDGEGEIADENKGINHVMDESDPEE